MGKSAFYQLQLIAQLLPYLEKQHLTVDHVLVISKIDYWNVLYIGLLWKSLHKFQQVQNVVDKLIRSTSRYGHMTPVLACLQ